MSLYIARRLGEWSVGVGRANTLGEHCTGMSRVSNFVQQDIAMRFPYRWVFALVIGSLIACVSAEETLPISHSAAVRVVEDLGGHVWCESEWDGKNDPPRKRNSDISPPDHPPGKRIIALTFDAADHIQFEFDELIGYPVDPPVKNRELRVLTAFPDILWLSLTHTGVTDNDMKQLAGLRSLQVLKLSNTEITDAAVEHLAKLAGLTTIDVKRTRITDAGAENLQRLLPKTVVLHESDPLLSILASNQKSSWSKSGDGRVACQLSTDKQEYVEGESIIASLTVVNLSDQTIKFAAPRLPNSPTGFLSAMLRTCGEHVAFGASKKAGAIVELKPKASHTMRFALGEHPEHPCFCAFKYEAWAFPMTKSRSLQAGIYYLQAQYFGKRYGIDEGTRRTNQSLQEHNIWSRSLKTRELKFIVLPDNTPDPPNRVASITCKIETDRLHYRTGESIEVARIMRNLSGEEKKIYGFHFLNGDLNFHWINRKTGDGVSKMLGIQSRQLLSRRRRMVFPSTRRRSPERS